MKYRVTGNHVHTKAPMSLIVEATSDEAAVDYAQKQGMQVISLTQASHAPPLPEPSAKVEQSQSPVPETAVSLASTLDFLAVMSVLFGGIWILGTFWNITGLGAGVTPKLVLMIVGAGGVALSMGWATLKAYATAIRLLVRIEKNTRRDDR